MIHEEYTNNFISRTTQLNTVPRNAAEKNQKGAREILFENNLIKSHSFRNIRVL